MDNDYPICAECHHEFNYDCHRDAYMETNVVTGNRYLEGVKDCFKERRYGECGIKGIYFSPRTEADIVERNQGTLILACVVIVGVVALIAAFLGVI